MGLMLEMVLFVMNGYDPFIGLFQLYRVSIFYPHIGHFSSPSINLQRGYFSHLIECPFGLYDP